MYRTVTDKLICSTDTRIPRSVPALAGLSHGSPAGPQSSQTEVAMNIAEERGTISRMPAVRRDCAPYRVDRVDRHRQPGRKPARGRLEVQGLRSEVETGP